MPKLSFAEWSTTANDNTDVGGVNIAEGCAMANLNNGMREMMAQLKAGVPITQASASAPASIALAEDTDNGTNTITLTAPASVSSNKTVTFQDASGTPALLDLADQTITGGARVTSLSLGNLSGASITPDPGDRPIQKVTNDGAGSILPGSNEGQYTLQVLNTTGAGAITTTGWTLRGDVFDTTTTSKFLCSCFVTSDLKIMTILKVA